LLNSSATDNHQAKETNMKIDLHVHSKFSRRPSEWILKKIGCPESFTEPFHLYNIARERGMTHITITDHNCIEGALAIAHLPGAFVSEEVTTYFPEDNCKLHVLVYNINETQHRDLQQVRTDVFELVPYLYEQKIFHILAHPLYAVNNMLTADRFEKLILLFNNFELNGARNHRENQRLAQILNAISPEMIAQLEDKHGIRSFGDHPWDKRIFGGSDDHSSLNIARTYTELEGASIADLVLQPTTHFRPRVHTKPASPQTMAHNIYSIAWQYYRNKFNLDNYSSKNPLVRFLDRSLLSAETEDSRLLSKVYFYFSRKNRKKEKAEFSDSLSRLLKKEIYRLIEEDPDLIKGQTAKATLPVQREQQWFDLVNTLSNRLTIHFSDHLLDHVSGADVFNVFQTIGSAGGIYTMLVPYFIAFTQFTMGRDLGIELEEQFQTAPMGTSGERNAVKIAHFTDTYDDVNGVALTLRKQVAVATKTNKQYTLITCGSIDGKEAPGVKHFRPIGTYALPEYPELQVFYPPFMEMLKFCHEQGFTQIHTATPGPIGLAAVAIAKILKLPLIGTYHTQIPQYAKAFTGSSFIEEMTWKFIRWYYGQMDVVYAPSESTRQELVQQGIKAEKVKLYPRGIDIVRYHPSKRNGFYKAIIDESQYFKFLYVGRVSKEKNLELLAKAFRKLVQCNDKVFLTVVGDGPYLTEMKAAMQNLPCHFTGTLKGDLLSAAYASSDMFVFPSTTDTFGNVILEAQASGLPVIVTDLGGPHENMVNGKTGVVVPGECESGLLKAMQSLSRNKASVDEMRTQARLFAEGRSFEAAFIKTWHMFDEIERQKAS
jgi:glycosyltransferase involved in cell wall biosynthesis